MGSLAQELARLPVTAAAFADGTLSAGQVEAIAAPVDDATVEVLAADESALMPKAGLAVDDGVRGMAAWRGRPRPTAPRRPSRLGPSNLPATLDRALDPDDSPEAEA